MTVTVSADGQTVRVQPRRAKMHAFTLSPEAAARLAELHARTGTPKSRIVADLILGAPMPRKRP